MKRIASIGLGALLLVGAITIGSQSVAAKDRPTNQAQRMEHYRRHHHHRRHRRHREGWRKPSY